MADEIVKQMPSGKGSNPTSYRSVANMTDNEITAAAGSTIDPLRAMIGIRTEDQLPPYERSILADHLAGQSAGRKPRTGMRLTGTADPMVASSGLAVGDRVYHKLKKKEGKIDDIAIKSGIHVKFDDGGKGWQRPENLVKL